MIDKPRVSPQIVDEVFTHEENHDSNSILWLDGHRPGHYYPRTGEN